MSFEAINSITQAEAEARAAVAGAELRARQLTEDAENAGKLAVEAALEKAGEELAELSRQVDEKAKAQAEEFGHSVKRELGYLTIHSILHLLGYDHVDEGPMKKQMRAREEAICALLDLEQ
jgi:rRNA maturation RNase YbeY